MATSVKLSEGALQTIMNGGTIVGPVVQVLGTKKMICNSENTSQRFRLLISDGKFKINVAMYTTYGNDPNEMDALEMYAIIKLKRHLSNVIKSKSTKDTRVLFIIDLELLVKGGNVNSTIGDPVLLSDSDSTNNSQASDIIPSLVTKSTFTLKPPSDNIAPIPSLNPFHSNWIIKVRVINKSQIRHWANFKGDGKLFSIDLVDKWGEIRCTVFRDLVEKFYDLIDIDKTYFLSKCVLKPINRKFCFLNHNYEMVFTDSTILEEVPNDHLIPYINYNFSTIDKIAAMVPDTFVDVIGICKNVGEVQNFVSQTTRKELKKREILLVDKSKTGISVVLWGQNAESFSVSGTPVIAIKNVKVSSFLNTKSLNMMISSQMKISPSLPEATVLKSWYDIEGLFVDFKNVSARQTANSSWLNLRDVQSQDLTTGCYFQTFATILYIRLDRAVYKSCLTTDCQKKVIDLENGMYRCEKCNREYDSFKYRLLMSMNISDATGSYWVTVFSSESEKLLQKTAQEIGMLMESDQDAVAKLFEEQQFKQFVFKCRAKTEVYNDEEKVRIIVMELKSLNYNEFYDYLSKQVEHLTGISCT